MSLMLHTAVLWQNTVSQFLTFTDNREKHKHNLPCNGVNRWLNNWIIIYFYNKWIEGYRIYFVTSFHYDYKRPLKNNVPTLFCHETIFFNSLYIRNVVSIWYFHSTCSMSWTIRIDKKLEKTVSRVTVFCQSTAAQESYHFGNGIYNFSIPHNKILQSDWLSAAYYKGIVS